MIHGAFIKEDRPAGTTTRNAMAQILECCRSDLLQPSQPGLTARSSLGLHDSMKKSLSMVFRIDDQLEGERNEGFL